MVRRMHSDCSLSAVWMDVVLYVGFLKCENADCGTVCSYCTPEHTSEASHV